MNNAYSNSEINDLIMEQAGETDESAREDLLKKIQTLETEDLSTIRYCRVRRLQLPAPT